MRRSGETVSLSAVSVREVLSRGEHDFDAWTRDGETALHVAAAVGAREAAEALLAAGANEEAGTKFDWRPLHYAGLGERARCRRGVAAL